MHTIFIIFIGILILSSIARGIYLEVNNDNLNSFESLHIWAGFLVLAISIIFIMNENQVEESINSKTIVNPSIKIETIQNDSNIIKSDTTYIYKFKNNN